MAESKVNIFDASLQKEVPHTLEVDQNNEIVATSVESGRQVKFPSGLTKAQFDKAIQEHKANNEGQDVIPAEVLEAQEKDRAKAQDLVDSFSEKE